MSDAEFISMLLDSAKKAGDRDIPWGSALMEELYEINPNLYRNLTTVSVFADNNPTGCYFQDRKIVNFLQFISAYIKQQHSQLNVV